MSIFFIYLSKLSLSLAFVYLFYKLLLQYLTFYSWNRWYLLGYSFLSFLIPFIDISTIIDRGNFSDVKVVNAIPSIHDFSTVKIGGSSSIAHSFLTVSNLALYVFVLGVIVMLARLILQWVSYLNIKAKAKLLVKDDISVYKVSEAIVPFSFGRSVFINHELHDEEELKEILRHEYVHVGQKHTIDIIWAEVLCLVNWYNPFAWLIRHNIRQNLEFIADSKVLENGIDKKQYQYLLLKVMGISQFKIATPFNFSSLKKRIVMMNKMKSARVHMVKFLFVLPLLAVLLIAFRSGINKEKSFQNDAVTFAGLVVQGDNYKPLSNVHFKVAGSKIEGNTDDKGYYTISFPVSDYSSELNILFTKKGYQSQESKTQYSAHKSNTDLILVEFIGMAIKNKGSEVSKSFVHSTTITGVKKGLSVEVLNKFAEMVNGRNEEMALKELSKDSEKPYWVINGHSYILSGSGSVSWDTLTNIVIADGKKMTGDEANAKIKRSSITSAAAKRNGSNEYVFEIKTNSKEIVTTKPSS